MYELITSPLSSTPMILKDGIAWIPEDPQNKDYQAYLEWIAEGNAPTSRSTE